MTPPEIAWIVPIVMPLLIGLVVGAIVKNTLKLIFTLSTLVILLVITGYVTLTFQDVFDQAMKFLPKIIQTGSGWIEVLPYSAATFIVDLILGFWKG